MDSVVNLWLKLSLHLLWPLVILAGTLETFQCENIPQPCLSWLRRVNGQGQGRYIEQRVQQRLNYLCGSTEAGALHGDHLEAATCVKNGNKAIVHSWTHSLHFTNFLGYWLLGDETSETFWQKRAEIKTILSFPICLGWHF